MSRTPDPNIRAGRDRPRLSLSRWLVPACLGGLVLAVAGCGLLRGRPASPRIELGSLSITNAKSGALALEVLEGQVMRFADSYAATVAQAVDDYNARTISQQARTDAMRWKLNQATAAWVSASGVNPVLNLLDLVVLATVSRMVMEQEIDRVYGPEGLPLMEAQRQLETEAWTAVSHVIRPSQQQELREMIEEWRRKNPNQRYVAASRFRELAIAVGRNPQRGASGPSSVLSLLFLDPFAGLDPTAVAIQETRQLAERALYYTQRMPALLNLQMQLLSLQLAAQPEAKKLLADADRFTRATEAFAKATEQLPQLVNDQREAAIRQILEGVAAERTNLLASLAGEEQKARTLLSEARQTLEAGKDTAVSVQVAIKTLDEFVRAVSPATNRGAAPKGRPFEVLDYGQAAGQIGVMAQEIQHVLAGLKQTTPELGRLRAETAEDAKRVLEHAFWLGLALVLISVVGAVMAALAYRALAHRLWQRGPNRRAGPEFEGRPSE